MIRNARQASGLFLALLALVAQLMTASAVPATTVSLADVTVLCHHEDGTDAPSRPPHQSPDCLLCFFCCNATGVAGMVASPPPFPVPATVVIARAAVPPPATAPPPRIILAARPRGPPAPT